MTESRLGNSIAAFHTKKFLVVGDVMLDRYTYGSVDRISPEAPVPVLRETGQKYVSGGASNTAHNLISLGAQVSLLSLIGKDTDGAIWKDLVTDVGIDISAVIESDIVPTISKHRFVAGSYHQLLRIDREEPHAVTDAIRSEAIKKIPSLVSDADCVVVSDYAKGFLSEAFVGALIAEAKKQGKPIIVDTKPSNKSWYKGATVLTPNVKEAQEMTGKEGIEEMGLDLVSYFGSAILLTQGSGGMTYFAPGVPSFHLDAQKVQVSDVSGAGDTVVATLALALSVGATPEDAVALANIAGGLVVQKAGTATISQNELLYAVDTSAEHAANVPIVPKLWGYEKWLINVDQYCCKILSLNRGYQCSLHYHKIKDETFLVTKGHARLELGEEIMDLRPGQFVRIQPGEVHRFTGIEDSEIIEVSTHHMEEDSYRIEESRKVPE